MTKLRILRGRGQPGGPSVTTGSLKVEGGGRESEGDVTTESVGSRDAAGFEDGGRGRTKLGKSGEWTVPWSLQRGMQPCQHVDFSSVSLLSDF